LFCERCGMLLQVVTVMTNSLLAQLNITVHVCGCYDVAADRMSSEQASLALYFAKLYFCDLDKLKTSLTMEVITQ